MTMKLDQVTEYNNINFLIQKSCRKRRRITSSRSLFLKKKKKEALYEVKASAMQLNFNIFQKLSTWYRIKTNNMRFYIIDSGIYILLTDKTSWLSWLLDILGNIGIAIAGQPGYDVINFEINVIFLIKPFF